MEQTANLTDVSVTKEVRQQMIAGSGMNEEQIALAKRTVAEGTTDDEFAMFLHYCKQSGLDPLRRQAHCIVREWTDKRGNQKRQCTMMTGIDGFRARAESFPDFLGCQSGVVFEGDDFSIDYGQNIVNHIAHFPRKSKAPIGAWAIVRRTERRPFIHWLSWPEIFDNFSPMHKKMPEVMAKKTVEAQAIRHEYPEPFSGLYDPSEIPREGESLLSVLDNGSADAQQKQLEPGGDAGSSEGSDGPVSQRTDDSGRDDDSTNADLQRSEDAPDVGVDQDVSERDESRPAGQESAEQVEEEDGAPDPPTDAQIERWVDVTDWAEENGYMTEKVHEEALAWLEGPPKPSTRAVGAKIGVWKARRERHENEWDGFRSVMNDCDAVLDDKMEAERRMKMWVMNPKTRIDGAENTSKKIIDWLMERVNLDL